MRAIKFRGKRITDGRWVYGGIATSPQKDSATIHTYDDDGYYARGYFVDPATVSQFTGLYDKNGKEIYEGDIVRHDDNGKCYSIIYEEPMFRFAPNDDCFAFLNHPELLEVVGNIHDNPELLEEKS